MAKHINCQEFKFEPGTAKLEYYHNFISGFVSEDEFTPPKTNMESENHLFEKENHLPNLQFQVPC